MRALLRAYYRLGYLVRELMKFGVVGGVAYIVDISVFNLLLHTTDKPLTSKAISTVVATTVSYAGNRTWTFRRRSRSGVRREYVLFFLLNGVGLLIALACLAISHYVLGFTSALADNIAANVIGLGLGTAFRFWSYRRWVFPELLEENGESAVATTNEVATIEATTNEVARDEVATGKPEGDVSGDLPPRR